jgi:hypothetical protein
VPVSRGAKIGIVGSVCAVMLGVATYGAYNMYTALDGGSGGGGHSGVTADDAVSTTPAGPPSAKEVTDTAHGFLTAWAAGQNAKAAALTSSATDATDALTGYRSGAHITSVRISGIADTVAGATFTVTAHIAYQGMASDWTYGSSLTVGRDTAGHPAVTWAPAVLYPGLGAGDSIVTGTAKAPDVEVTDRHGAVLTGTRYPSLARIINDLKSKYADKLSGGTSAVQTYVAHDDGSAGKVVAVLRKGKARKLPTTIDAHLQTVAEKAVKGKNQAGAVALDTNDGGILAVAYSPTAGFDNALQGKFAPGSTYKIVTAAALLQHGMGPHSAARCDYQDNIHNGKMYHNDSTSLHNANADLTWDFANSCNTGFITQADALGSGGLRDAAAQFGLTQPWNVGTATPGDEPGFPSGTGPDELTSEMIGQGQVVSNPLIVASVAATASTGSFHQPRIVSTDLIDGGVVHAPGVGSRVSSDLREMMRATITSGTASAVMGGFGPNSGAKTGSAEVDQQANTNGWFTAFSGHVAAGAMVGDAGFGNTSAGPIVAQILAAS